TVPQVVGTVLPALARLADAVADRMLAGGRLFYLGSGTSGRLGVVDASECPPTFGVPHGLVVGIIAGGDAAIRKAREGAEDDRHQGWQDLLAHQAGPQDTVLGITASGTTPYVLGALQQAREAGLLTASLSCCSPAAVSALVEHPLEVVTGPEFVTGSTRLKAGTAQKLVLNMLSTTVMIRLGRVHGNRMVDMLLTNDKLIARGTRYVAEATGLTETEAQALLLQHGSVRAAVTAFYQQSR
ncbi:MAG: N-acetylmuramic acid 6-phosphate etherase, partial [Bacteroidetes bacterium]|nr:N-acetylmuramic acid 6-phosphate etherase [Bacteroidota bacterium]